MTQKFGLEAILSAKIDQRSLKKDVVDELEDALDDASTIDPEVEMGALERQMRDLGVSDGSLSMSRESVGALSEHSRAMKGSRVGTAVAGAAGGRMGAKVGASRAGAAASGAMGALSGVGSLVSGGLLMVGIAGVVGIGILKAVQSLAKHSPALGKALDMLGMAWDLFWRPFGNALADRIFPMAKGLLQFTKDWNKWAKEGGLSNAFKEAGKEVGRWIYNYFKDNLTSLATGDSGEARNSGARLGTLAGGAIGFLLGGPAGMALGTIAGNLIGQLTGFLIGKLNNIDWRSLMVDAFGPIGGAVSDAIHDLFPNLSVTEFLSAMTFPTVGAGILLSHINWPAASDLLGVLKSRLPTWSHLMPELPTWGSLMPSLPNWSHLTPRLPDWSDLNPLNRGGNNRNRSSGGGGSGGVLRDGWAVREAQRRQRERRKKREKSSGGLVDTLTSTGPIIPGGLLRFAQSENLIPFASGGIVNSPTRALIGEAGSEAVIPLDRLPRLMAEGMKSVEGSGTGMDGEALNALTEVPDLLRDLIDAVEDGGDVSLNMDGETIARASRDAGDRFLSRREVHK